MVRSLLLLCVLLSIGFCMGLGNICSEEERRVVECNDATDITSTSATVNGSVTTLGSSQVRDVHFLYYGRFEDSELRWTDNQTMTYGGDFSAEISGLVPDNRYYFRAADSDDYRPYEVSPTGWWCSFDTRPVVETLDATEISSLSATLNGNLPSLLPSSSSEVYFQWGTESGSYPNETPRQTMTSAGTFSAEISGLYVGATYYYVARALKPTTSVTASGEEKSFYVDFADVTVQTLDPTGVSGFSATLKGDLSGLGGRPSVEVYFRWGTSTGSYPNETSRQTMTSASTFSAIITGLTPGTTYYYTARAGDTAQGVEKSFYVASASDGTVETLDAGYPAVSTMAWLYGNLLDLGGNASVEVYFLWGESPGVYTHETPHQTKTDTGNFSAMIMGPFNIGSTYYFVARVGATGQGAEKNFTVV